MREALENDDLQGTFSVSHRRRATRLANNLNSPSTPSSFAMDEDQPQDFLAALDWTPSFSPEDFDYDDPPFESEDRVRTICDCGAVYVDVLSCRCGTDMQRVKVCTQSPPFRNVSLIVRCMTGFHDRDEIFLRP